MLSARTLVALALFAGCQKGDDADSGTIVHTLQWHQGANTEIQDCHVFKLANDDEVEIDRIRVKFPSGSHHVHIYRSDTPDPDGVADCWTGIDWTRWHLVLGAQTQAMDWKLPAGLSVPLDKHQQLLVQVHWLNTTDKPIDGKIELSFHTTERSDAHVGVLFGINKQTAMAPHQRKVLRHWCPMPEGAEILAIMGHYHGLGQKYSVTARGDDGDPSSLIGDGKVIYEALGEQTFQFKNFDPAYEVPTGHGLEFECDFFNYRDHPIVWSADIEKGEHCNLSTYYYPAEELSTFCMVDATEVSAIVGPTEMLAPDDLVTYRIELSDVALAGGAVVRLAASDPTMLAVPDSVTIPEGQKSGTFQARALRPGRLTVTAKLGSTSQVAATAIGGLVLSEVHVGEPGATDQRQWVELANLSDVAIDLSRYSLGAGKSDYTRTRIALNLTLPPKGCVVVGGPQLTTATQPPYDQVSDFDPDLGRGVGDANGVALFDVPSSRISAHTLPYDTLVYGDDNNVLVDASGQLAPVVARPPANGTYFRTTASHWETQPGATPRICEVR